MKMPIKFFVIAISMIFCINNSYSQNDTLVAKRTDSVIVYSSLKNIVRSLPDADGVNIYAGKKTNLIDVERSNANLSQGIIREIFAKIPGLTTWDMDGAGTQINIGSRGTDSHRSIEMNMRQNGYNTNSDIFGYPEDHYTPPMQAIQSIQLIRGSAALQYGSQFGGMMNFVMKESDNSKPFVLQTEQTVGSNNFFNSFTSVSGTNKKLSYYSYFDYKHGDGWRPNSVFNYHAYYLNLKYAISQKASIAFQFSRMDYVQQIAGGLTDAQFNQNAKQSIRTRNYFNPEINIAAVIFKYAISDKTQLQITSHALFGERNSVQFINNPTIADSFNTSLGSYNPRQVDRDYYKGLTTEARILHQYRFINQTSSLAAGVRIFNETTNRKQKGVGTAGSDFDLSLIKPYVTDLELKTNNFAAFAENLFKISSNFSITPGVRWELINTNLNGYIQGNYPEQYRGDRNFILVGTGLQYAFQNKSQLYGNISQEYRPYLYASVTPSDRVDVIDPNLKDSKGYDIDLGYRNSFGNIFQFDVNVFYVFYGNRAGLISKKDANGTSYLLTTNIGDAVSKGVEAYTELSLVKWLNLNKKYADLRIFNSLAYTDARYTNAQINKDGVNISLNGNAVENVPVWSNKTGVQLQLKRFFAGVQFSYTGRSFNDALNTISSTNGVTGIIPDYRLYDLSFGYSLFASCRLEGGINNMLNEKYFSRRITMYPGPGILPADGRTFYVSLKLNTK